MKCIPFLLAVICCANLCAQDSTSEKSDRPLEYQAYRKMIRSQFSYAILGKEAPVTGFKVEAADPKITIAGNIVKSKYNRLIINASLTGGLTNGIQTLFASNKLNGYFKFNLGFNVALKPGPAQWDYPGYWNGGDDSRDSIALVVTEGKYLDLKKALKKSIQTIIYEHQKTIDKSVDTAAVVITLIETYLPMELKPFVSFVRKQQAKLQLSRYKSDSIRSSKVDSILWTYLVDTSNHKHVYDTIRKGLTRSLPDLIKLEKLIADYATMKKREQEDYDNLQYDFAIEQVKNVWKKTKLRWFNISPSIENTSLTMHDAVTQKLTDTFNTIYGLDLSYNKYIKHKGARFTYSRSGFGFTRSSNLDELGKVDYRTSQRVVGTTDSLFVESTGKAYTGVMKHGFEFNVFSEWFIAPFKIPFGFYLSGKYRTSDIWITKHKLAVNLGLIWNVTDNTPDAKNVLTIIPYCGWSNILTEYTDFTHKNIKSWVDLFSVNVKVGIPINVGK